MSIYQLYANTGVSTPAAASIDVQFDGIIVAYHMWIEGQGMNTDADMISGELSFLSSNMMQSNDARGVIGSIRDRLSVGAAGAFKTGTQVSLAGIAIAVQAGERIYIHTEVSAGNSVMVSARLYIEDQSDPGLRRRR